MFWKSEFLQPVFLQAFCRSICYTDRGPASAHSTHTNICVGYKGEVPIVDDERRRHNKSVRGKNAGIFSYKLQYY